MQAEKEERLNNDSVPKKLEVYPKDVLYQHQIEGLEWLYKRYLAPVKGGILADDMG